MSNVSSTQSARSSTRTALSWQTKFRFLQNRNRRLVLPVHQQNAGVLDILDTLIVMQDGALGVPRSARQADKHDVAAYMFGTETVQ